MLYTSTPLIPPLLLCGTPKQQEWETTCTGASVFFLWWLMAAKPQLPAGFVLLLQHPTLLMILQSTNSVPLYGPWGLSLMKDGVRTILVSLSLGKESNWFPVTHEEIKWALSLFQYLAGAQATGWCFWKWRIICELQDEALCEKTACRWKLWKVILFWTGLKEHCYGLRGKKRTLANVWFPLRQCAKIRTVNSVFLSSVCLFVLPWSHCCFNQNCAKSNPKQVLNILQEGQGFIPRQNMTLRRTPQENHCNRLAASSRNCYLASMKPSKCAYELLKETLFSLGHGSEQSICPHLPALYIMVALPLV